MLKKEISYYSFSLRTPHAAGDGIQDFAHARQAIPITELLTADTLILPVQCLQSLH